MKMKFILSIVCCLGLVSMIQAQKVQLKGNEVLVDGEALLSFKQKLLRSEISLFDRSSGEEIVYIYQSVDSGQDDDPVTVFTQIVFIEERVRLETCKFSGGLRKNVKKLIEEGVIDLNGQIDPNKLDIFLLKYDETELIYNRNCRGY